MIHIPINIAKEVNVHKAHLVRINNGQRKPSPELAARIITAMAKRGIKITLADLRPDIAKLLQPQS